MDTVLELEQYLQRNRLDEFVKSMMVSCLRDKPEEPAQYLLRYILNQNAGQSSDEVAVASFPQPNKDDQQPQTQQQDAEVAGPAMHVALCCEDKEKQEYLTSKKVHIIFLELLSKVIKEQPENPLSFLALCAHNLHKSPPPALQAAGTAANNNGS